MRYKRKKNNKAALFLLLLVIAGYVFVNFGHGVSSKIEISENVLAKEKENVSLPEDCPGCEPTIQEEIIYEEGSPYIIMIDEEYTIDVTEHFQEGEALGLWSFLSGIWELSFWSCANLEPENILDSVMKLCPPDVNTGNFDFTERTWGQRLGLDSNNMVNVDAVTDVELTLVTYPLAFFLGQHLIENSNREATLESPNYPSLGQIIDENYTIRKHSPQDAKELEDFLEETVREQYAVTGDISIPETQAEEGADGRTEYVIDNVEDEPECLCEEPEVSSSDFNPGSPNRQGYSPGYPLSAAQEVEDDEEEARGGGGYLMSQGPGGDDYGDFTTKDCLELNQDYILNRFGNVAACLDIKATAVGFFRGIISRTFQRSLWDSCNLPPPTSVCTENNLGAECLSGDKIGVCTVVEPMEVGNIQYYCYASEDAETFDPDSCETSYEIAVRMSPIFGDPYDCTEELCANAYLTNSYKAGLSPMESSGKRIEGSTPEDSLMYFLATPCRANVTIGEATTRNLPVPCLWDVSPYLLNYKLESTTTSPGQEGFPSSFDIYWDLIMQVMPLASRAYKLNVDGRPSLGEF